MIQDNHSQILPERGERMKQATTQETELATKVRDFWNGLSPAEQARLDCAIRRVVDEAPDVSGHTIVETADMYGPLIYLILLFL
jgi:hypothetical protein